MNVIEASDYCKIDPENYEVHHNGVVARWDTVSKALLWKDSGLPVEHFEIFLTGWSIVEEWLEFDSNDLAIDRILDECIVEGYNKFKQCWMSVCTTEDGGVWWVDGETLEPVALSSEMTWRFIDEE